MVKDNYLITKKKLYKSDNNRNDVEITFGRLDNYRRITLLR